MTTEAISQILQASSLASGLISKQQMEYCLRVAKHRLAQQGLPLDSPVPDRLLADILVEQEVVTEYQVDQLLMGRTKFNLGSYIITDWIGQGGMGQVFKAVHHVMGRICAVKVLPLTRATLEARQNFLQEIRMQAVLDCPYLVRAYDAGHDGNVHYLVTEFVPGMDLRRLVRSQGPLPLSQSARIILQAALGLEYAHSQGLVHRDVKPGNILVTPDGDAKVSDVGLAGFAKDLINDPRAGKIIGTADYLSPEQIRTPLEVEPTSDIYSLGCTLYYALCGKVPFPGGDTKSKLRRHLEESPVHPRRFAPEVPEDFVDIIADMMEKDPKKRIARARQVADRLEPWATEEHSVNSFVMVPSPWLAPPPPSHDDRYLDPTSAVADPTLDPRSSLERGSSPSLELALSTETGMGELTQSEEINRSDAMQMASGEQSERLPGLSQIQPLPVPPADWGTSSFRSDDRPPQSSALTIAITIAIVLPPALLLGAIVGFLLASQ
jgi:eukaryotic-like serine/threonine-protein kinase